jgi:hypothetical protein
MGVPEGAVFEDQVAGGIALYDVSALLPVHKKKKYEERDVGGIVRIYNHHSGALGKSGYEGLLASTKYGIRDKKKKRKNGDEYIQKGWPGQPYTFWYSFEPDYDDENRIVIYRANLDVTRSYHTGKDANGHGVGVAWQGNLTKVEPSAAQIEMAEAHFPWCLDRYGLTGADYKPFSWHAEAGEFGGKTKKSCPGPHVTAFVQDYRSRLTTVLHEPDAPPVTFPEPDPELIAKPTPTPKPGRIMIPVKKAT